MVLPLTVTRTPTASKTPTRTPTHTGTPPTSTPTKTATSSKTATPNPNIGPSEVWRFYYYAGSQRIAVRVTSSSQDQVYYLFSDHLGSLNQTVDTNGVITSGLRYYPFGVTRAEGGTRQTELTFTGQREQAKIGLLWIGSRWYDASLGRWVQPDTIVPDPLNPVDFDRYSYVRNRPIRFTDPSGHYACDSEVGGRCVNEKDVPTPIWDGEGAEEVSEGERAGAEVAWLTLMYSPNVYVDLFLDYRAYADSQLIPLLELYAAYSSWVPDPYTLIPAVLASIDEGASNTLIQAGLTGNQNAGRSIKEIIARKGGTLSAGGLALKFAGRGQSHGRHFAQNDAERSAMEYVKNNPGVGKPLNMDMADPRWPGEEGWMKFEYKNSGVTIHYLLNYELLEYDDIKIP